MAVTLLGCSSIPRDLPAIEAADAIEIVDGGDVEFHWHPKKGWGLGYGISKLYASVQNVVGSMVDSAFAARARAAVQQEYAEALQAAFPDKRVFSLGRTIREAHADPRSPVCTFLSLRDPPVTGRGAGGGRDHAVPAAPAADAATDHHRGLVGVGGHR